MANRHLFFFRNNDGTNCGLTLSKIVYNGPGGSTYQSGSVILATVGYLNPSKYIFFRNFGTSLKAEYLFIPRTKGVFYID